MAAWDHPDRLETSPGSGDASSRSPDLGSRRSWPRPPEEQVVSTEEFEELGPIDYVVLEWPTATPNAGGAVGPLLLDLVDRGIIRIYDIAFIAKDEDGNVVAIDLAQLNGGGGGF